MIETKTDGDLLIITGSDDADRPEIEASVKDALGRRMRVNVFRRIGSTNHMVAALTPTGAEIHVRGPKSRGVERTPRDAAWRGLSRFLAANFGAD